MVLALDPGVLDQVPRICLQPGHGAADVLVNLDDFLHRRRFEERRSDALLHPQDDALRRCYLLYGQWAVFQGCGYGWPSTTRVDYGHVSNQDENGNMQARRTPIAVDPSLIASREYST